MDDTCVLRIDWHRKVRPGERLYVNLYSLRRAVAKAHYVWAQGNYNPVVRVSFAPTAPPEERLRVMTNMLALAELRREV